MGSRRGGTYVSAAVIAGFWLSAVRFLGNADGALGLTVTEIFWRVTAVNTAIIGAVWLLLKLEGASYRELGFSRVRPARQVLVGSVLGVAMFVLCQVLLIPIAGAFLPGMAPVRISAWFEDLRTLPMWLFMAIYGGGIGEELTRVFALTRFEKLWGRPGLFLAVTVHAVTFGMAHLYQGPHVAAGLGLSNLVLSLIFMRRRSAVEMIAAHATFDLIGISLGFLLYGG